MFGLGGARNTGFEAPVTAAGMLAASAGDFYQWCTQRASSEQRGFAHGYVTGLINAMLVWADDLPAHMKIRRPTDFSYDKFLELFSSCLQSDPARAAMPAGLLLIDIFLEHHRAAQSAPGAA